MNKISIVVPVCGRLDKLNQTIDSISKQTYQDIEVIFVENNSDNPSLVVNFLIKESKKIKAEIKVVSLKSCNNANVARNYGADLSTGDYIAFLDSDDLWDPNHLKISIDELNASSSQFIYGGAYIYDGTRRVKRKARDLGLVENPVDYLLGFRGGWAQTSSYLLEKNAFDSVRWDESLNRCQDLDFFIRAAKKLKTKCTSQLTVTLVWLKDEKRNFNFLDMSIFYRKYRNEMSFLTRLRYILIAAKVSYLCKNIDFFRYIVKQ